MREFTGRSPKLGSYVFVVWECQSCSPRYAAIWPLFLLLQRYCLALMGAIELRLASSCVALGCLLKTFGRSWQLLGRPLVALGAPGAFRTALGVV
jgi:hypothetical protein